MESGKVLTVQGAVSPSDLGRTLTHEHLSLNFEHFFVPNAPNEFQNDLNGKQIRLNNVGIIRQYPYASRYNVNFCDKDTWEAVQKEMALFKTFGGGTIVENTTHGIERNLDFLHFIALQTGIKVVAGTGHYVASTQSASTLTMTVEQMTDVIRNDLMVGTKLSDNETTVRCGFIGEVGSTWPIHDFERRAIEATAIVQSELNCGVSFHPGRDVQAPFEIVRLYLEAGGKADKCVMSHLDRTLKSKEQVLDFGALGVYCQFDLFGTECSFYQLNPLVDMPSDAQRIDKILDLVADGRTNRVLLSHDIHTKHRLMEFGGHGFSHIYANVLPRMLSKGLYQEQIDRITIKNPAEWLSCNSFV